MADIIQEIKVLEQGTQRKIAAFRIEQEKLISLTKKHALEDIAHAQSAANQERESLLRKKEQELEEAKQQALSEANAQAVALKEKALQHRDEAITFIIAQVIRGDGGKEA